MQVSAHAVTDIARVRIECIAKITAVVITDSDGLCIEYLIRSPALCLSSGGYSLAALSSLLLDTDKKHEQKRDDDPSRFSNSAPSSAYTGNEDPASDSTGDQSSAKESMLNLFGVAKMTKSGVPSKVKTLPSVWELQTVRELCLTDIKALYLLSLLHCATATPA